MLNCITNRQKYYYAKTIFKNLLKGNYIDHIEYTKMMKIAIKKYGDFDKDNSDKALDIIALKSNTYSKEDIVNEE